MLTAVKREIEQTYFDPALKSVDFNANATVAKERIDKAESIGDAFSAIAQFVLELDDSHTFFLPPRQTVASDYGWLMGMVGDTCYVLRVKPGSDAARQGVAPGDVVKSVNGWRPTRATLWRIEYLFLVLRPQPGLHVELITPKGVERELNIAADVKQSKKVVSLVGAESGWDISRLIDEQAKQARERKPQIVESGKQVLVARLPSFSTDEGSVHQVLSRAHGREVLILDLRGNSGGAVDVLQTLLGGLFANDITIGSLKEREKVTPQVAKGAGSYAFGGRVFVLVDAASASASELLARAVQLTERGTVIGDRTAGAVMVARQRSLVTTHGENVIQFGASVTVADVVMSDVARLEKKGVTPDFIVLPTADDLASGRDPALAQALKFAGQTVDAAAAGALLSKD